MVSKNDVPNYLNELSFSRLEGKNICLSGKYFYFDKKILLEKLDDSGAIIQKKPTTNTDFMISGQGWTKSVRDAAKKKVPIISIGELLNMLSVDDTSNLIREYNELLIPKKEIGFQLESFPSGLNLSKSNSKSKGKTLIKCPDGIEGELLLHWEKVNFPINRRYNELFGGIEFSGGYDFFYEKLTTHYLGRLYFNGEAMKFGEIRGFKGEKFSTMTCSEDGSDDNNNSEILFSSEIPNPPFNCTFLKDELKVNAPNSTPIQT